MNDNTIIPSYFNVESRGSVKPSDNMNNVSLRVGEVKAIFYPDDEKNISKKLVEYTVEVLQQDGQSTMSSTLYHGCVVSHLFGGVADSINYTLRPAQKEGESGGGEKKTGGAGVGSKVLLLCINGNKTNAVIIGGLPDFDSSENDKKDDGHNLKFEFNGVQMSVNKDGELQVRYRGQTKVDGKLSDDADSDAEGSTLIFDKEGSIKLYTKDEKQFIYLNHKDKKLDILADEEWHVKVNKKLSFEAGDEVKVKGDKTCTIEMSDKVYIKSAGVHVGDATDAWLLADTYRKAESQMLNQIATTMQSIMSLISTAASTLISAAAANAPPIVGGIAAASPFAAAGAALTSAAPMFAQVATAIQTFESQASTYLSKKNKND